MDSRDYDDIPGTYVFDSRRARQGYALNRFLQTLDQPDAREAFRADPEATLAPVDLTDAQRRAVLDRDWLALLHEGGNIFCIWKLAVFSGTSMQEMGASMSGVSPDDFRQMMLTGGRHVSG